MKRLFIIIALIITQLSVLAQESDSVVNRKNVSLTARVYYHTDIHLLFVTEDPFDFTKPYLFVEGFEDAIPMKTDSTGWCHIENLPYGCHCYVVQIDPFFCYADYFSHKFQILSDTIMPEILLEPDFSHVDLYKTKIEKDSTLKAQATFLVDSLEVIDSNGWYERPRSYWLGRLYYHDWALYFDSMRTFEHPADSAYKYFLYCYHNYDGQYKYLYYTIRQLEEYLGITNPSDITPPVFDMEHIFTQLPDNGQEHIPCLLSAWEQAIRDISYGRTYLAAKEKSLSHPIAPEGTFRIKIYKSLSLSPDLYRLQDSILYYKRVFPFDSTIKEQREIKLKPSEKAVLDSLISEIHAADYPPQIFTGILIDGPAYKLEYIKDGKYYSTEQSLCIFPYKIHNLCNYLEELYSYYKKHKRRE